MISGLKKYFSWSQKHAESNGVSFVDERWDSEKIILGLQTPEFEFVYKLKMTDGVTIRFKYVRNQWSRKRVNIVCILRISNQHWGFQIISHSAFRQFRRSLLASDMSLFSRRDFFSPCVTDLRFPIPLQEPTPAHSLPARHCPSHLSISKLTCWE